MRKLNTEKLLAWSFILAISAVVFYYFIKAIYFLYSVSKIYIEVY